MLVREEKRIKRVLSKLSLEEKRSFRDKEGNTLLHLALFEKDFGAILPLIREGLLDVENTFSQTPKTLLQYRPFESGEERGILKKGALTLIDKKGKKHTLDEKRFKTHFGVEYLSSLSFTRGGIFRFVTKRTAKKGKNLKFKKTSRWISALLGEEMRKKTSPLLEVKWVNPFVGYGVFARESIAYLSYVGEYTGEVKKREKRKDRFNDYIFGYDIGPYSTPYVIDAKKRGNVTRFINHSDNPNLTSRWIVDDGICHVIFFANRKVDKGEQLTYDYGPYYWKKRSLPLSL